MSPAEQGAAAKVLAERTRRSIEAAKQAAAAAEAARRARQR